MLEWDWSVRNGVENQTVYGTNGVVQELPTWVLSIIFDDVKIICTVRFVPGGDYRVWSYTGLSPTHDMTIDVRLVSIEIYV